MERKPISMDLSAFPDEIRPALSGARLYDSSCSPRAKVLCIDKDEGYFLKRAPKGSLEKEFAMTNYFHGKALAPKVLTYLNDAEDWLLTERIPGEDCVAAKHLEQPERLTEILAQRLFLLHHTDFTGCPFPNHTEHYISKAVQNHRDGIFDKNLFPDNWGYRSAKEAFGVMEKSAGLLKTDTLLHGDYCLPNILLLDWNFSGFVDLDSGGVGDKHVDLFWALWTLRFNLKTDRYRERFLDVYGRADVSEDCLRVVAAVEVFL